jgi:hypothetical protein
LLKKKVKMLKEEGVVVRDSAAVLDADSVANVKVSVESFYDFEE